MDSWYPYLLFLHVTSAMALAAALGIMTVCEFRISAAWTLDQIRHWVGLAERTGKALGVISPILLFSALFLVYLRWSYSQPWVVAAIIMFLVMAISGRVLVGGRLFAIREAAVSAGSVTPAIRQMIDDPLLRWHPWIRIGVFGWLLFLMTTKPGFGALLVTFALSLALSAALMRANRPAESIASQRARFEST